MSTRPNVVILHTDQQRYDSLGCNGSAFAVTPNIDGLASEGARFTRHFVQNPVCMPSRMSLLTGRYPSSLGIGTNGIPLPAETLTLAGMLKRYGYETVHVGKLHFQPHSTRDHRGFHPDYGFDTLILSDEPGCYRDAYRKWVEGRAGEQVDAVNCGLPGGRVVWERLTGHRGTMSTAEERGDYRCETFGADEGLTHASFVAEESVRCIRQRSGRPFLLFAGFYAPHPPLIAPRSCLDAQEVEAMPVPVVGADEQMRSGYEGLGDADWRRLRAHYQALVSDVDRNVGKILAALKREELEDETLVIFTSDHGEYLGDHGRVGKGTPGFDCITHVPLIMRYPGRIAGGREVAGLVEAVDVLPTILDYCSVQADASVQGRSLVGLLDGSRASVRDSVLMEHRQPGRSATRTVRTEAWKYSLTASLDGGSTEERLYDLSEDDDELKNVAGD